MAESISQFPERSPAGQAAPAAAPCSAETAYAASAPPSPPLTEVAGADPEATLERELFQDPPRPRAAWVRGVLTVFGILFVIAGVALGPVPVVPGFPLIIAGALMLAASNATARRGMNRLEHALPRATRTRLRRLLRRAPPCEAKGEKTTEQPKAPPTDRD
jgi:hypothetical protein